MPIIKFYQVYVLRNEAGKYYIGLSEDVQSRLEQHNSGKSTWTRHRGPWSLVWASQPMSLTEARKLENRLKRQKGGIGFHQLTGLQSVQGSYPAHGGIGSELRIKVTAPPVDAAANEALLRLLAKTLNCPRDAVVLLRDHTSRHKVVKLHGLSAGEVMAKLQLA